VKYQPKASIQWQLRAAAATAPFALRALRATAAARAAARAALLRASALRMSPSLLSTQ